MIGSRPTGGTNLRTACIHRREASFSTASPSGCPRTLPIANGSGFRSNTMSPECNQNERVSASGTLRSPATDPAAVAVLLVTTNDQRRCHVSADTTSCSTLGVIWCRSKYPMRVRSCGWYCARAVATYFFQ